MIRSAKPSPLTSPAEATEVPLSSSAATPLSLKPLVPSRADEVEIGAEARGLAEHHVARAEVAAVRIGAEGTDDQVGEAVAVDVARRGNDRRCSLAAATPLILKPLLPSRLERSRLAPNPEALPNTT